MKITLIAQTHITAWPNSVSRTEFVDFDQNTDAGVLGKDADRLAHFAGRSCYQSWNMPNSATATDKGYIANIIKQQHFSVLEHASATFYVEGVSRNLTHELIRHRHLSYSELSQRYINMEDAVIMIPPAIDALDNWLEPASKLGRTMSDAVMRYNEVVEALEAEGVKGKKAREAARALLPGGTETKIVVTGNHRAWRDMLNKRYSVHADAEIQLLSSLVLEELRKIAPAIYQDFPNEPFA